MIKLNGNLSRRCTNRRAKNSPTSFLDVTTLWSGELRFAWSSFNRAANVKRLGLFCFFFSYINLKLLVKRSSRMIQLSKSWTTSPSIVAVNETIGLSVWKRLKKAFNFSETISKLFSLAGKIGSWIMVFSLCQLLLFLRLLKYVTNFFNHQGVIQTSDSDQVSFSHHLCPQKCKFQ